MDKEAKRAGVKVAFIFPGQGSQAAGMGKTLAEEFPESAAVMEEGDRALGFPISQLCYSGPQEQLRLTENTQPAVLCVSMAALRAFQARMNLKPAFYAGHSLGEFSALVAAGAMSFADAVRVVRMRGRFMQEAVPEGTGAMAALLGIRPEAVQQACEEAAQGEVVEPANFNSPGQVVISGHKAAVERASAIAKKLGASRVIPLQVSAPFHCKLMEPVRERLAEVLEPVEPGEFCGPVVTNVEARPNSDRARVNDLLVQQVVKPVRWEESIREMAAQGIVTFVEFGPGKVLCGLVRATDRQLKTLNVEDPKSLDEAVEALSVL